MWPGLRLLALELLLLAAVGCDAREESASPTLPSNLRIATYNVHAENRAFDETAAVIRRLDADVVCLQELPDVMANALKQSLRDEYPHQVHRDAVNGYGGLGFWSRYPLRDVEFMKPAGGGWFPAWIVRVAAPGGEVQILNVHLLPPSGMFTTEALRSAATEPVHVQEIRAYAARLEPGVPAVVLGDFNESEIGDALQHLHERGFSNPAPRLAAEAVTRRGTVLGLPFAVRIDHVLHSAHFEAQTVRVLEIGKSDHYPVVVELDRRDDRASR